MDTMRNFDRKGQCPICKGAFQDCKHSLLDIDEHFQTERIRAMVKKEVKTHFVDSRTEDIYQKGYEDGYKEAEKRFDEIIAEAKKKFGVE